jgi:anti-sigma regulatory factor (Ser/Thr protein kinase)
LTHYAASQLACRPWEHSGLRASQMISHSGRYGVSLKTPWMARTTIRHLLTEWRATAELTGVAELLTSEIVTNAVRFAPPVPPARAGCVPYITLGCWYVPGLVVVEVSDENEKPPEMQVPGEESEGGRGLLLIEALSREWSYYYPRRGWKTVYCVIGERIA